MFSLCYLKSALSGYNSAHTLSKTVATIRQCFTHYKGWSKAPVLSFDVFRGQVFIVEDEYSEEKSEKYQIAGNGLRWVSHINSFLIYYTNQSVKK